MLDLRVTAVTDEGCADTTSAKCHCSMALLRSSAQGGLVVSTCKNLKAKGVSHKIGRYLDGAAKHFGDDGFFSFAVA